MPSRNEPSLRLRSPSKALAAAALLIVCSAGAARAQSDPGFRSERPGPQLELYLSSLFANSATEGSFGLRAAFHLAERFALEGSLSRLADDEVDLYLADVSAKYYVRNRGRARVYLLAGPGIFLSGGSDIDEPMLHFGLGSEIALGRRFYVRPELRGRWFAEAVDAVSIGDLAVGFGWRFR